MDLTPLPTEEARDTTVLLQAPSHRDIKLLFQAFLTKLSALETGLVDNDPDDGESLPLRYWYSMLIYADLTYAVAITCRDGTEPDLRPTVDYTSYEGNPSTTEKQPVSLHFPYFTVVNYMFPNLKIYHPPEGPSNWAPVTTSDGLHPSQFSATRPGSVIPKVGDSLPRRVEQVLPIKAIETGIVDVRSFQFGDILNQR